MKVSIAMTAYRGELYIGEQLESLGRQTRVPDEVIVTDDSPDDALRELIAQSAQACDLPISYHHNTRNLGFARNFEKALSLATGDVVFFCDQDNSWFPEKIATMLDVLDASPATLVAMNDAAFTDGDLNRLGTTKLGQFRRAGLAHRDFVMGCCAVLRRELVDLALPFPEGFTHDGWTVGLCDLLGATQRTDTVLQLYRIHGKNQAKDFVVNAAPGRGRLGLFWHGLTARIGNLRSSDNILREARFLRAGLGRVRERGYDTDPRFRDAVASAEARLRTVAGRLSLRAKGFPGRVRALMSGGAARPTGVAQVAKDLLAARIDPENVK